MPTFTALWDLGALTISGTGAFNLDGLESRGIEVGLETVARMGSGQVDNTFIAVNKIEPTIPFTCNDVSTALSNIGISGMEFPQSTTITTVDAFFTQYDQGGTRLGSTNHFRVRMAEGMIVPQTLSADQDGVATLACTIHTTYDGSNEPFAYAASTALDHVPVIGELFTLGPVSINGTEISAVQGWSLDFGIEVVKKWAGGSVRPYFVGIKSRKPKITIKTNDVTALNTFGITGTAQGSTDSVLFLTAKAADGANVADATTSHISLTIDDGIVHANNFSGAGEVEGEIIIEPVYDGTNAVVVIATGVAISV